MAISATELDGNNVALLFTGGSTVADVFTLNYVDGTVTSAYLPKLWLLPTRKNALKLFPPTTVLQRQTVEFLTRLIALGNLDTATVTPSAVVVGQTVTLRITVSADTAVLAQLPHSIMGGLTQGQPYAAAGGGGGGLTAADLGTVPFPGTIDSSVADGLPVCVFNGILYAADASNVNRMPCIGVWQASLSRYRNGGPLTLPTAVTANSRIFVAPGGGLTSTPPTGSGQTSQLIGFSVGTTTLIVAPQQAITLS
jgi:hypothetical protein